MEIRLRGDGRQARRSRNGTLTILPALGLSMVLLAGVLLAGWIAEADAASPNARNLRNLRIAGAVQSFAQPFLLVHRDERQEGQDFNGDLDTRDVVAQLFDLRNDGVINLGLASDIFGKTFPRVEGRWVILLVRESSQGRDLNGDGDTRDKVVHLYDRLNATLTAVSLTGRYGGTGLILNIVASEADEGTDLNGDGDLEDTVLHVLEIGVNPTPVNLGLAIDELDQSRVSQRLVAFVVREPAQGSLDLNGDSDTRDGILHVFNLQSREIANLGFDVQPGYFAVSGTLLFILADESADSTDYNQDGDRSDRVLHVYDSSTETLTNVGVATGTPSRIDDQILGGRFFFAANEFDQGFTDLNGDGDIFDEVAHLYDHSRRELTNLELAAEVRVTGDLVSIVVDELAQGLTDLNGDGDFLDRVQHVFDPPFGVITNLEVAVTEDPPFVTSTRGEGRTMIFKVDEQDQGSADFNLNGVIHAEDDTLFVYDAIRQTTTCLSLVGSVSFGAENRLVVRASESRQNTDFNRDGDLDDDAIYLFDTLSGILVDVSSGENLSRVKATEALLAFSLDEEQCGEDLNRDGDRLDQVVHFADVSEPYGLGSVNSGRGAVTPVLRINGRTGIATVPTGSSVALSLDAAPAGPQGRYALWGWAGHPDREVDLQVGGVSLGRSVNPTPATPGERPRPYFCVRSAGVSPMACRGTVQSLDGPPSAPFSFMVPLRSLPPFTITLQGILEDAGSGNPLGWSVTNAVTLQVRRF